MARPTKLKTCVSCGKRDAQTGVCINYYVLRGGQRESGSKSGEQIKGCLPSRGHCAKCFLRFAGENGMDSATLENLRRLLQPLRKAHRKQAVGVAGWQAFRVG